MTWSCYARGGREGGGGAVDKIKNLVFQDGSYCLAPLDCVLFLRLVGREVNTGVPDAEFDCLPATLFWVIEYGPVSFVLATKAEPSQAVHRIPTLFTFMFTAPSGLNCRCSPVLEGERRSYTREGRRG